MKLIDLSQEIAHRDSNSQHISHPTPLVFPYITHEESRKGDHSYTTEWLNINTHTGTHMDAPKHQDPRPNAKSIDQMPLNLFYGEAICLDVSHVKPKGRITANDLQQAIKKADLEVKLGDIVLLNTGHWKRTAKTTAYRTDHPGLDQGACEWLLENGVKCFGVDATAPETREDQINGFTPCHDLLRDKEFHHIENLSNLDKVAGKRFTFIGFPIKIKNGSGAPVRAVAILK